MGFGSTLGNLFSGFTDGLVEGLVGTEYVKDYKHASNTFRSDGYALAPQPKFLFHVYFNLNGAIPGLNVNGTENAQVGMMVKGVSLPSFSIETAELNQYNRKRYVQKKITYDPVRITLHDDGSDLVRTMWYNYFQYYYNDPKHMYEGIGTDTSTGLQNGPFDYNKRDIYDNFRSVNDWGFNGQGINGEYKPNFFRDIKIYGLNRGNFVSYTLINPMIVKWEHDSFDTSDTGGVMQHQMVVKYETVKYHHGKIGSAGGEVKGWGEVGYDHSKSKLSKAGSTTSIFGQGGLLDAGDSIMSDLTNGNILGAALTAGRSYNTWKDADIGSVLADEGIQQVITQGTIAARSQPVANSVNNFNFLKPPAGTSTLNGATTATNGGFTSVLGSLNPFASPVNTDSANTGYTSVAKPWNNPNAQPQDTTLRTTTIPGDVSSNGSVINRPSSGTTYNPLGDE